MHAVEMDRGDCCIRRALRLTHGLAKRGYAQHSTSVGDDAAPVERSPGMKYLAIGQRRIEAGNHVAPARTLGVTRRRKDDAQRRAPVPLSLAGAEPSFDALLQQIDQIGFQTHHDRLRFRVA